MARLNEEFWDTPVFLQPWYTNPGGRGPGVRTGVMNVYELVHQLISRKEESRAQRVLEALHQASEKLTARRIWAASELRLRQRHRKLSYADAAGYVTAQELGIVFVTTDGGFEGLPGVKLIPRRVP